MRYPFTKKVNQERLQEELTAAFPDIAELGIEIGPTTGFVIGPDTLDTTILAQVIEAHQESVQSARQKQRAAVALSTLVGKNIKDLTAAEVRLLVAAFLYKVGALDGNLNILPFSEWL